MPDTFIRYPFPPLLDEAEARYRSCENCGGEGGFEVAGPISKWTDDPYRMDWTECPECHASGWVEGEPDLVTEDDLDEIDPPLDRHAIFRAISSARASLWRAEDDARFDTDARDFIGAAVSDLRRAAVLWPARAAELTALADRATEAVDTIGWPHDTTDIYEAVRAIERQLRQEGWAP